MMTLGILPVLLIMGVIAPSSAILLPGLLVGMN
jgi:hypothetical protein